MNKIEHQKEHFDSIAEKYYTARQGDNHLLYKHLLLKYALSGLNTYINPEMTIAVLEPMCGYGEGKEIVSRYITNNIDYEGFDYSDELIRIVKENNPSINIYKCDVTKFDTSKRYDIIILIGGLHHVYDCAEAVVNKMGEILKPGGFFINFEPTHNNVIVGLAREIVYKFSSFFDDQTEHDFSLRLINEMYRKAGLEVWRQIFPGLLAYILWYNPDAFPILNIGNKKLVKKLFKFERKLISGGYGRVMSFTTFSVLRKSL